MKKIKTYNVKQTTGNENWPGREVGVGSAPLAGAICRYLERKGHRVANRFHPSRLRFPLRPSSPELSGNPFRQTGHELWSLSHGTMQSVWYICMHGSSRASPPTSNSSLQTGQNWESFFKCASVIFTVGIALITNSGTGDGPGRSFCVSSSINSFNPGPKK